MVGSLQAMKGFLEVYGYPDPTSSIGWSIDPTVQAILGSFPLMGGCLGAMACGPMGAILSRRYCLVASAVGCIVSIILMMATTNFGALYFSRVILGIILFLSRYLTRVKASSIPAFPLLPRCMLLKLLLHNCEELCLVSFPSGNLSEL